MKKEIYIKSITDALGILSYQVENRNTINLYDINILSENFYKDLLNLVYGYELVNLNTIDKNASAIDLGDKSKKISIQVTSDNSSTKIKKTIDKFIEYKLYEDYNILIILILVKKKSYTTIFDTNSKFIFDKSKHIMDYTDLVKYLDTQELSKLKLISDFLESELNNKVDKAKKRQATEVETIIDLVEYLSENKKKSMDNKKTEIDPNYKINKRFKDHADFLKTLYINLAIIYESSVEEANKILGMDDIKEFLISTYLKDISNRFLIKNNGNPQEALDELVSYFEEKLSISGKSYDTMAIKYYLISNVIECNVFPNF